MPRSMTGFGRSESFSGNRRLTVEIRSVNHKNNELYIKLPKTFNAYEEKLRKKFSVITRGKTEVFVSFESFNSEDYSVSVNYALVDAYVENFREIKARHSLNDEPTLSLIARMPDVFTAQKEENPNLWDILSETADEALSSLLKMRETEGAILKNDILSKLDTIEKKAKELESLAPLVVERYKERLLERLKDRTNDILIDENRILAEVMLFADKACIDEEIVRLYSHVQQFRETLDLVPAGKKLDFLSQELFREANTISAKASSLDVTKLSLDLKCEIEKIREQVANIE